MLTQEQIAAIYEKAMDNQPAAGLDVTEANESVNRALDDYCSALQYETFLWAYELGYNAGRGLEIPCPEDTHDESGKSREQEGWI